MTPCARCPILPRSLRKGGRRRPLAREKNSRNKGGWPGWRDAETTTDNGCPRSGVPTDRSSSVGWRCLAFGHLGDHEPKAEADCNTGEPALNEVNHFCRPSPTQRAQR